MDMVEEDNKYIYTHLRRIPIFEGNSKPRSLFNLLNALSTANQPMLFPRPHLNTLCRGDMDYGWTNRQRQGFFSWLVGLCTWVETFNL